MRTEWVFMIVFLLLVGWLVGFLFCFALWNVAVVEELFNHPYLTLSKSHSLYNGPKGPAQAVLYHLSGLFSNYIS